MDYDLFNGDADGICALIQLRKADPRDATLVTGVKRDINLLSKVQASVGDRITVLDVSMDKNKAPLEQALAAGAEVFYCDHHFPGEIPEHDALTSLIDESPNMCTAAMINKHLKGRFVDWAVTGAFGDNLKDTARRLAEALDLSAGDIDLLEQLGTCINYNGYGVAVEDLHFDPAALYRLLYQSDGAIAFTATEDFRRLSDGYREDMASAAALKPSHDHSGTAVFVLPNKPWARRVSGVYSNDLATENPERAHAVLTEKANGNFLASVRAPLNNKQGAAELCMKFPSGGGRAAAAGINDLPADQFEAFVAEFSASYRDA